MLSEVMHIGITVSDMERSISFYRDILGLDYQGELIMEGPETDALFRCTGCKVRVAYLNGSSELFAPPLELIQFLEPRFEVSRPDLQKTSISEICFRCEDIDKLYRYLKDHKWSACPNRSLLILQDTALARAERYISKTRMESF